MLRRIIRFALPTAVAVLLAVVFLHGPTVSAQAPTIVTATTPQITLIPISATAAVNTQTTLTIPAPPGGMYNYVCSLAFQLGNDTTATVVTNVVSTSTNFNSFAVKVSQPSVASNDTGAMMVLNGQGTAGCAKSTAPGTATTFVSPAGVTHAMWTWYATYYQAQ